MDRVGIWRDIDGKEYFLCDTDLKYLQNKTYNINKLPLSDFFKIPASQSQKDNTH